MSGEWGEAFRASTIDAMRVYDDVMVPALFDPWAAVLLDEVGIEPGAAVLDVATGPGTVARRAAERAGPDGSVVGCDISPAMLGVAAGKAPPPGAAPITFCECPADALAVPDGSRDVVTCQQGLQFFPDRRAALTEMHRVLRPGGRAGIALWAPIETSPAFAALAAVIGEVVGDAARATYESGPWGLTDPGLVASELSAAGFGARRIRLAELVVTLPGGPGALVSTLAVTPLAAQVAQLDEPRRAAVLAATARAVEPFTSGDAIVAPTASYLFVAQR